MHESFGYVIWAVEAHPAAPLTCLRNDSGESVPSNNLIAFDDSEVI